MQQFVGQDRFRSKMGKQTFGGYILLLLKKEKRKGPPHRGAFVFVSVCVRRSTSCSAFAAAISCMRVVGCSLRKICTRAASCVDKNKIFFIEYKTSMPLLFIVSGILKKGAVLMKNRCKCRLRFRVACAEN